MIAAANAHAWWWLARATGIVAWSLVTTAIVWGLTLSSKAVRRRGTPAWFLDLHKYLGTLTLAFVAVHIAAIAADSYVDFGLGDLFVPMASSWRPAAVAWGIVAFYLLLAVEVSSWLMRRISRRVWHWIHLSSFAIFAMASIHGALAGADRAQPWVQFTAVVGTTIMLCFVAVRLVNASGASAEERDGGGAKAAAARARAARAAPSPPVDPAPAVTTLGDPAPDPAPEPPPTPVPTPFATPAGAGPAPARVRSLADGLQLGPEDDDLLARPASPRRSGVDTRV